ncbi:hypothetical protein GUITHDRAFT_114277 [Guillardia theta CCMP2712]|uniref:Uncharacterized protein n=1 Tax=Guillardia theta (strain CCMP2712) TaxID=905079 RepID=L1ITI8_GUITC|nr:hypothetical protein GUITHDRAFT_114277 [Guillardia theta CCMP2712]EKX39548.1 hypothetical protein GUITHDRAFT_114277 [Guillardia theta CCMP2712]|eukprot:XP_005826528.1 hypothetical protein GUITHDRAFT_114277 [Guillardia theta CCMP2712]
MLMSTMSLSDVLVYLSQQKDQLASSLDSSVMVQGTCLICNLDGPGGGGGGAAAAGAAAAAATREGEGEDDTWRFSAVISLDEEDGEGDLEIVDEEELRSHVPRCWVLCWRQEGTEGRDGALPDPAGVWRKRGQDRVLRLLEGLVREATRVWIWGRCTCPKVQLLAWEVDALLRRVRSYPLTRLDGRLQQLLQLEAPWSQLLDDLATRHRSWSHVSSCRKWLLLLPAHEESPGTAVILTIRTFGDRSELQALICTCEEEEEEEGRQGGGKGEMGGMEEAMRGWMRGIVTDICYWLWGLSL